MARPRLVGATADRGTAGVGSVERVDFAVVGAGVLGLAAGRALAARGHEVTVLEQATPGHQGGGSAGSCRIFRFGYADPAHVTAVRRARELWHELESQAAAQILFPTPQLTFGAGLTAVREAMLVAGVPCELLPAAEAAARFPGVTAGGPVLLEPESCVTAADTALAVLAAGVPDLRTEVRVSSLADDGRRVTLHTSHGPLSARAAVICTGPWTAGLLAGPSAHGPVQDPAPGWRVPSAPTSEQVAYLAAAGPLPPGGSRPDMPIFICHGRQSPYGLPVPGTSLYKTGIHPSGPPVRPGEQDQAADPVLAERLAAVARQYLPGHDPRPTRVERCVYDNSPDEDFILDRVGNVVIGCGTSGHGFKFGPLLGEWLAGLATEGRPAAEDQTGLADGRLALARFSRPGAGTGSR
jgi:sarcosine oxidase